MDIRKQDLKLEFFKSSGPGGQRKNKSETAVRATHLPTGITVTETSYAQQYQNKKQALARLEQKLAQLRRKKKKRVPTKLSRKIKERVLEGKRKRSEQKKLRKVVDFSDY